MAKTLKDKTVVITGAASGVGYAIANNFLKNGVKIILIVDINEQLGIEATRSLKSKHFEQRVEFHKCDVTSDLDVFYKAITQTNMTVDILVNCAGAPENQDVKRTIDTNVTALIQWTFKFYDHMRVDKSGKGGTIINVASILSYQILPYVPVYQASKFAVIGFTKSLGHAYNFGKFGVRVLAICPGFTESRMGNNAKPYISESERDLMNFIKEKNIQKADVVGIAVVNMFEIAESGTAWEIAESKPIVRV